MALGAIGCDARGAVSIGGLQGYLVVRGLRSALGSLSGDAREFMYEHDGGLGFVSMLAAGT